MMHISIFFFTKALILLGIQLWSCRNALECLYEKPYHDKNYSTELLFIEQWLKLQGISVYIQK